MPVRTMRDVPTIQGLRNQATPATREQAVTEVVRLEHELARLKRELNMWTVNQNKTAERRQRVEQRLTVLREILHPREEETSERRLSRVRAPEKTEDEGQGKSKGGRTVNFQY